MLKAIDLSLYRVLVTGAAGYIGREIVLRLCSYKAEVIGVDREKPFDLPYSNFSYIRSDITSNANLESAIDKLCADNTTYPAVIHLAGISHAGFCNDDPEAAFDSNVQMTVKLMNAGRKKGVKYYLFPSTGLVYGNVSQSPIGENTLPCPNTLYAFTKLAAEIAIEGFARQYNLSCDVARLSNVYGPRTKHDTVISLAIDQALNGNKVCLNNLTSVRDFIYIDDVAEGVIRLLITGMESGFRVINLSTGKGTTIEEMTKIVCRLTGLPESAIQSDKKQSVIPVLILDNTRLRQRTSWSPKIALEDGLRLTIEKRAVRIDG
jgi:UDP-glucose 4-epimerase